MAYTLLDAAYAMYYPEAEFAAAKGGLIRRAKATGLRGLRMAKRGARAAGRGARRAGGFAMRNKGKLALAGAGLAGLGLAAKMRQGRREAGVAEQGFASQRSLMLSKRK